MMDKEFNYTPWLIRRTEREFFRQISDYVAQIRGEISLLEREVDCFLEKDFRQCVKSSEKLFSKSRNAIKTRKALLRNLERGDVTPSHRGYMANLIYTLADIAGYIDSASAKLSFKELRISGDMKKDVKQIMVIVSDMIGILEESISLLNVNLEDTLEKTERISELEDDIDNIRRSAMRRIVSENSYQTDDRYLLMEIVTSLERISDMIDRAGQKVEVIAMTHLP